jgi:hypothetical protein
MKIFLQREESVKEITDRIVGPMRLPLLGNLLSLDPKLLKKKQLHLILEDLARKYGKIYSLKLGKTGMFIMC